MKKLTQEQLIDLILQHEAEGKGIIFSVEFEPRTKPGTIRKMLCRTGVHGKKGGSAPYNFHEKKLTSVFDLREMDFRSIPWEGIKKIKVRGKVYERSGNTRPTKSIS